MTNLEKKIQNLLSTIIENLGYILYDVVYVKEGKEYYLRILIDNKTGITLDDCEKVSNAISDVLDEANYMKEQYFLEVSSTGVERVLRNDNHFKDNINQEVEISLFKPMEGTKNIIGILKGFSEAQIKIEQDSKLIEIDRENIALIKTIYKW